MSDASIAYVRDRVIVLAAALNRSLVSIVFLLSPWLKAQQLPTIQSNVRQVLVPVVVTDKNGHHVTGLKAEDFQIFEDGEPQKIIAFSTSIDSASQPVEAPAAGIGTTNPKVAPPHRSDDTPSRTYLICVDTLHSSFANFSHVRDALKKFFEREQSPDSQYALIALGRDIVVVQDSTRDPAKILAAIQNQRFLAMIQQSEASSMAAEARQFTYFMRDDYCARCACDSTGTTSDGPTCSGAKGRLQLYLSSSGERTSILNQNFLQGLMQLVKATTSMPTTRTIVFISDGFSRSPGRELYAIMDGFGPKDRTFEFNHRDKQDKLQAVLKLALHYDVKFYTLDSRGLYTAGSAAGNSFDASFRGGAVSEKVDGNAMSVAQENADALDQLARETGGLFFQNSNDLLKGLQRAFTDGREYYVLAYRPTNETLDGTFRKIKVDAIGKKIMVTAKQGYWATKD